MGFEYIGWDRMGCCCIWVSSDELRIGGGGGGVVEVIGGCWMVGVGLGWSIRGKSAP